MIKDFTTFIHMIITLLLLFLDRYDKVLTYSAHSMIIALIIILRHQSIFWCLAEFKSQISDSTTKDFTPFIHMIETLLLNCFKKLKEISVSNLKLL